MNYIWSGMILISLICAALNGRLDAVVSAAFDGASASVSVILSLAGLMCFWTGLLKIAENSGASAFIARLLSPPVNLLFKGAPQKAKEYIAMNMSANLLGSGNAATPMGIKAMKEMEKHNPNKDRPTKNMCMLVAVNTASFQLLPTTIIAIRSAAGSAAPQEVILPIWIASALGFTAAVLAVKLIIKEI